MPDFPTNTSFIAVCGPVFGDCGSHLDGWFSSDFYLMYQMFKGLGAMRRFYTTVEPKALLEKHNGHLLHGSPKQARKIVLCSEMTDNLQDLRVLPDEAEFRNDFLSALTKICSDAVRNDQPVFLMLFGHGDSDTSGVTLGRKSLSGDPVNWPKFGTKDARKICEKFPSLRLSIMTTSCYAGPWANIVDVTAMTASDMRQSLSWSMSSSERFSGSPFTSAFISVLASEDEGNTEEEHNFEEFADMIKNRLCDLTSSFGHEFMFNAAHGNWSQNFRKLTDIPKASYQKNLEALRTVAPSQSNIDANTLSAWGLITARTGSIGSARTALREMSLDYLAGKPEVTPKDHAVHSGAVRCSRGDNMDPESEALLWSSLSYRKRAEATTASLLYLLDLVPFPALRDWELEGWLKEHNLTFSDYSSTNFPRVLDKVMPKPAIGEGWYWSKPAHYLTAACMKKGLKMEEVQERAERARRFIKKNTLKATDIVMGWESTTRGRSGNDSKLMTLGRTIRARIRSNSPVKRQRPSLAEAGLRGENQ